MKDGRCVRVKVPKDARCVLMGSDTVLDGIRMSVALLRTGHHGGNGNRGVNLRRNVEENGCVQEDAGAVWGGIFSHLLSIQVIST